MDGSMDAQFSAEDLHVLRFEHHGIVVVDAAWFPIPLQSPLENQLESREISLEGKAAVEEQAGGIINKGIQIGASHFARPFWIGQPGSLEHICLPQIIAIAGLKTVQILSIRNAEFPFGQSPGL